MAATGYTPILIYASGTATNVPLAANLTSGATGAELALNYADGKLYYKDSGGVVQLLASKAGASGSVTSVDVSGGTTGLTTSGGPVTTSGTITLAGTLITSNGGTGLTSYTAGDITYYASGTALSKLGIGTNGQILTSSGTAPQWTSGSSISVGTATNLAGGAAGSVPYQSGAGATTFLSIGTANYVLTSSGSAPQWSQNLSIGSLTASADSTFSSTGALTISKGTTGQQPGSPVTGMLRYNTTTNQFEGYSGSSPAWNPVGGASLSNDTSTSSNVYPVFASATSGTATTLYTSNAKLLYKPSTGELQASELVASNGILVNSGTVSASYTISSGNNGFSVGPVTVNSGVSVTVSSGQRWLVL